VTTVCRLLLVTGSFVGFNGNGKKHWGRGYHPDTWLRRCGFAVPQDGNGFRRRVRAFLGELSGLNALLGIIPVGMVEGVQLDLEELRVLAGSRRPHDQRRLRKLCLRFYAPEDYLARWRRLAAGTAAAPASDGPSAVAEGQADLRADLRKAGMTQQDLATHLNCDRSFVSRMLSGVKPWPEKLLERARRFLAGRSADR
jgi:hypothetical protein